MLYGFLSGLNVKSTIPRCLSASFNIRYVIRIVFRTTAISFDEVGGDGLKRLVQFPSSKPSAASSYWWEASEGSKCLTLSRGGGSGGDDVHTSLVELAEKSSTDEKKKN